jgi:hypothetical protein
MLAMRTITYFGATPCERCTQTSVRAMHTYFGASDAHILRYERIMHANAYRLHTNLRGCDSTAVMVWSWCHPNLNSQRPHSNLSTPTLRSTQTWPLPNCTALHRAPRNPVVECLGGGQAHPAPHQLWGSTRSSLHVDYCIASVVPRANHIPQRCTIHMG